MEVGFVGREGNVLAVCGKGKTGVVGAEEDGLC